MIVIVFALLAGFVLLIKGADLFVSGASSLAKRMRISELIIGLTVVAFGTSAPELVVNVMASVKNIDEMVMGNVLGSNIFNLLLILGISGIIYPIRVNVSTIWKEIPLSLLAAIVLFFLANDLFSDPLKNDVSRLDGIILLGFFSLFMIYIFISSKKEAKTELISSAEMGKTKTVIYIILGLAGLVIGGQFVVNNAVKIARELNMSDKLISLTIVSIGTSLPELATSIVAAIKKKGDLAVGNVIGSNIFNIFFILGISSLVSPVKFDVALNTDILILIVATVFLFTAMFSGERKKLDRWEATVMLAGFLVYMVFLIIRK